MKNSALIDDVDVTLQYKTLLYCKQNTLFGQVQGHNIAISWKTSKSSRTGQMLQYDAKYDHEHSVRYERDKEI